MKSFPTLFKKNNNGSIQYWSISVDSHIKMGGPSGYYIITCYGQKDTDSPQETKDLITEGKNIGKKNETSVREQAEAEAFSRWEKKKKKGYVEKINDAEDGKVDKIIRGGIEPMLAHTFDKQGHKIKFPCFVQPKLDGHRCIAIINHGKCELWTRTRKIITSVPHINEYLSKKYSGYLVLDGELYNHKFKNDFEYISHIVRQETPDPHHTDVQYHIYDIVSNEYFKDRFKKLCRIEANHIIKVVETTRLHKIDDITSVFKQYLSLGYEGIMLRNSDGLYVNKRSYDLIKVKEFEDAEFEIIGIKEGRGKLSGHVGAFTCKQDDGTEFDVKMAGDTDKLKDYFNNSNLWKNKLLTVQFQGRSKYGVPRFPVGLRIRDDI